MLTSLFKIKNPILYLVTESTFCVNQSLEEAVESALAGGVNVLQLREKNAKRSDILDLGRRLKDIAAFYQVPLIVNDDVHLALALDADGVHLGQSDLAYHEARDLLGPEKIIGLTVNSLEQAKLANDLKLSYLGVSPIFYTNTKKDVGSCWQLDDLKRLRKLSRHLLIGIGGIDQQNVQDVMEIGFDGVAVISAILRSENPKNAAWQLLMKMRGDGIEFKNELI